jgi:hypothetical protein
MTIPWIGCKRVIVGGGLKPRFYLSAVASTYADEKTADTGNYDNVSA